LQSFTTNPKGWRNRTSQQITQNNELIKDAYKPTNSFHWTTHQLRTKIQRKQKDLVAPTLVDLRRCQIELTG
jgi:hypothetical protein